MTKAFSASIVFYLIYLSAFSQGMTYIDTNQIKAGLYPSANMFIKTLNDKIEFADFEFPKNSGIQSVFYGTFWVIGKDSLNRLVGASNYYDYAMDWGIGPVASNYSASFDSVYKKVYKVSSQQIQEHVKDFKNSNFTPSAEILQWPGNGNTQNGESKILANFTDVNRNGVYEPRLGEYPTICGDQEALILLNDDRTRDSFRICNKMKLEAQVRVFSFANKNNILDSTIFLRFSITNKSSQKYHDAIFSFYIDPNMGCYNNNHVGCDTTQNTFYTYKRIENDNGCFPQKDFGNVRATQAVSFLNKKMVSFVKKTDHPFLPIGLSCNLFRAYQEGRFYDSSAMIPFGNGYSGQFNPINPTKFLFHGTPTDSTTWSCIYPQNGPSLSADFYLLIGSVSLDTFYPNETKSIDLAIIHVLKDSIEKVNKPYDEVNDLLREVGRVKDFYITEIENCGRVFNSVRSIENDPTKLYPNPTSGIVSINSVKKQAVEVMDISGKLCATFNINIGSSQIDISILESGVYFARIDSTIFKVVKY